MANYSKPMVTVDQVLQRVYMQQVDVILHLLIFIRLHRLEEVIIEFR